MKGMSIIFGLAGAAIGAAVSYFVTKSTCEKKYEQQFNDIRDMYEERIEKVKADKVEIHAVEDAKAAIMQNLEEKVNAEKLQNQNSEYIDYTSAFKKSEPAVDDEDIRGIKFITESEAQKYSKDYELVGLTLYDDDVLIDDETENIIANSEIPYWIGDGNLSEIRNKYGEESVYILNTERSAIYDITVLDERFGVDDERVTIH